MFFIFNEFSILKFILIFHLLKCHLVKIATLKNDNMIALILNFEFCLDLLSCQWERCFKITHLPFGFWNEIYSSQLRFKESIIQ
jgi:hypothetical protein